MMQGSSLGPKESVEWCDQTVSIASLTNPPVHLVRTILWELFELGFHHELHAIDHMMVPDLWVKVLKMRRSLLDCVWPGPHGEMKWEGSLPRQKGDLGFTNAVLRNPSVFNSFCVVLSALPGAHPGLYKFATAGDKDETQQAAYETFIGNTIPIVQEHEGMRCLVTHIDGFWWLETKVQVIQV